MLDVVCKHFQVMMQWFGGGIRHIFFSIDYLRLATIAYKTHSFMISPTTAHLQNRACFLKLSTPSLHILVQRSFVNAIHISVHLLLPCNTLKLHKPLDTFCSLHQSLCQFEIFATAAPLLVVLCSDMQYLLLDSHDSSTCLIINENWHIHSFTFMPFQMDLVVVFPLKSLESQELFI